MAKRILFYLFGRHLNRNSTTTAFAPNASFSEFLLSVVTLLESIESYFSKADLLLFGTYSEILQLCTAFAKCYCQTKVTTIWICVKYVDEVDFSSNGIFSSSGY